MSWRDHLRTRLQTTRPASVCALDAAARELAGAALPDTLLYMPETSPPTPCFVALGVDILNGMDRPQAEHLISRTLLYVAPRLLLAAQAGCALDETAFRALGFMLVEADAEDGVRVYAYDLDTYKSVPDWLNARFWAHPERWEP